jgi:hypothetical protein
MARIENVHLMDENAMYHQSSKEIDEYLSSIPADELPSAYPFFSLLNGQNNESNTFVNFWINDYSFLDDAYSFFLTNAYSICKNPVPYPLLASR